MNNKAEINREVNIILKKKYDLLRITNCEIGQHFGYIPLFAGCMGIRQGYAHDQERRHYTNPQDMACVKHTLSACIPCHTIIDSYRELRVLIFSKLRPPTFIEPMVKQTEKSKEKLKSKKPIWYHDHKCKNCGKITSGIQCRNCGGISV